MKKKKKKETLKLRTSEGLRCSYSRKFKLESSKESYVETKRKKRRRRELQEK